MLGRQAFILLCDAIIVLIFILWLLPTTVGFRGQEFLRLSASVTSDAAKSSRFVRSATSTSTSTPRAACGRRVSRWRHRGSAIRVGGLSAALEIKSVDSMENGCVLVAGEENFGHMTSRAVALVYEHAGGQASKAVCLDKGLTFTIGEMIGGDPTVLGQLADNRLFRGGDDGSSSVIMVHKHSVAGARALGDTGLYVGGLAAAVELTDRGGAKPEDFKFFFSHLAWPDGVLEEQVEKGLWKIAKLRNDVVLDAKQSRDMELWGRIERELKKKREQ